MTERIVILGAGIAGCIAYHALRNKQPLIVEATSEVSRFETHKALMRLRDSSVATFIGAEAKEIEIQKAVFSDGLFEEFPSIYSNNMYSMKLYGELGKRSMLKPGSSKRFILPSGFPVPGNIQWDSRVDKILPGAIRLTTGKTIPFDHCISTLPMPLMYSKLIHPEHNIKIKFNSRSVYVQRLKLLIPSEVNQTIYFPDNDTDIYRITIQGQDIIIESIDVLVNDEPDIFLMKSLVSEAFGVDTKMISNPTGDSTKIGLGKIRAIPEQDRMKFIFWLTDKYNILSFGRYSVWKPLRTDELMTDVMKIKKIISAKGIEGAYRTRLRS